MSEVVNFIKKTLKTSQTAPAFILSDSKQMFLKAYQRCTDTSIDLHSTRLKEKHISKIPGLQAHRGGKQVILTTGEFTTEAALAALSYNDDDDGKILVQVAKVICQDLFNNENKFKFNFDKDSPKNSVPMSLTMLLQIMLDGEKVSLLDDNKTQDIAVSLSQLVKFKGALSGLRQFLATENPLKMMKNAFYSTSKVLFVLKIFKFLS